MHRASQASSTRLTDWTERTAIAASLVCLIHCAGLPLLFAVLPMVSKLILLPASFHFWVLVATIPASAFALIHGALRHRRIRPLITGTAGLGLLVAALAIGSWAEVALTLAGSCCLFGAHFANWQLRHGSDARGCDCHG